MSIPKLKAFCSTGSAGTGKSHLLKMLVENAPDATYVTALTGIAAVNVGSDLELNKKTVTGISLDGFAYDLPRKIGQDLSRSLYILCYVSIIYSIILKHKINTWGIIKKQKKMFFCIFITFEDWRHNDP